MFDDDWDYNKYTYGYGKNMSQSDLVKEYLYKDYIKDITKDLAQNIDQEVFNTLCKPKETDEEKVVRIIKGGFEKAFGMSYDKFVDTYHKVLEETPEKLI